MHYELFIAFRYLLSRRNQAALSVITVIAVTGIAVGVAALIFAQGLAKGFRAEVQEKILSGTAHLNLLKADNSGIENYRDLAEQMRRIPGVRAASATSYEIVLLSAGDRQEPATIKGIDLSEASKGDENFREVARTITEGSLNDLQSLVKTNSAPADPQITPEQTEQTSLDGVILGRELARALGVQRGDLITVFSSRTRLTPLGPAPRTVRFRVVGLFSSGLYEYDSKWAYVSLTTAQRLSASGDTATVIQMKVDDIYSVTETGARVLETVKAARKDGRSFVVTNWQELNRPLFAALQLQQRLVVIFFLLLIVVAALNIVTTLVMMVIEKQRDIAILRAQGVTPQAIRRIFMWQGTATGFVGAILGIVLGLTLGWASNTWRLISVPAEIYSISHIAVDVRIMDCLLAGSLAVVISFLATLYPAGTAARMKPAEILRYE